MKVGISEKHNKPLPIAGFLGGLFGSIASAGIQGGFANEQQKRQMQHDKDMAALQNTYALEQMGAQQEYNKENMSIQNQYQVDQWNRENEYNDPSAVAQRYRSAGINPRAAFGQGSASGAGISGGLSSAPSGGTPSSSGAGSASNIMMQAPGALNSLGATLSTAILEGRRVDAEVANKNAETAEQLIENEYKEQNLIADLLIKRGEYEKLLSDKSLSDTQRGHYEKLIEGVDQQIEESRERTKGYASQRANVNAQTENTKANTNYIKEDTNRIKAENAYFDKFGIKPSAISADWKVAVGQLGLKGIDLLSKNLSEKGVQELQKQSPIIYDLIDTLAELPPEEQERVLKSFKRREKYKQIFNNTFVGLN